MNINIKTTNTALTDEIQEYFQKRFEHIEKFLKQKKDQVVQVQVELGKETNHHIHGEIFFVKARLESSGEFFYAEAEEEDLLRAIDNAKDALIREITSHTKKKQDLERREGSRMKNFMKRFWR